MSEPSPEPPDAPRGRVARARTRDLAMAGLLAALLSSSAWISLPVGTVPLTLQVFVAVLIALLLPPGWTVAASGVYLLLGGLGAPVFAGGRGGLGVLVGPTGGYLFGFLVGAAVGALARAWLVRVRVRTPIAEGIAALVTVAIIYVLGWAQLTVVTHSTPLEAFAVGVAPFVLLDIGKAAAAVAVATALRRAGVVS